MSKGILSDTMADKLKISSESSGFLNILSSRLVLKRNVVCRIAISISLSKREPVPEIITNNTEGYEFNKTTILGPDEVLFKTAVAFVQGKPCDKDYFNILVRNHLERGLEMMYAGFMEVNSPTQYLAGLSESH